MFRSLLHVLLHRQASITEQSHQTQIIIKGIIKLMKQGYFHFVDKGKALCSPSSTGAILMGNKATCLH